MPADAVVGLIGAAALLWVVFGPWQLLCTDAARFKLFQCRDELFDMAANGELSFQSQEYPEIRDAINALIRYSYRLTVPRLLFVTAFPVRGDRPSVDVLSHINAISSPLARARIERISNDCFRAVFIMVGQKSLPTLFLFSLAYMAWKTSVILRRRRMQRVWLLYLTWRKRGRDLVLLEALCFGS
jgi:hypothetical protein